MLLFETFPISGADSKGTKMKITLFMILFLSNFVYSGSSQSTMASTSVQNTAVYADDESYSGEYESESEVAQTPAVLPAPTQIVQVHQAAPVVDTGDQRERDRIVINMPPITMQMTNTPQTQTTNTFAPQNTVLATSESKAITVTQHWQQLNSYVAPLKKELSNLSRRWYEWIDRWPRYAIGGTYGSLFYLLVKSNYAMNSPQAWGQWKNHMSLQEMQRHPQSKLAQDLLSEIQNRYMNKINPTDSITPLTEFIAQLQEERTVIERYLIITTWLSRLWLKKIFPFNSEKIEQAKRAQERLNFINHIFISWAATHNINKITA